MSFPPSILTPYKAGLFSGKGVIVTGGGTGLGYAIGKSGSCIPFSYDGQNSDVRRRERWRQSV